jgi:hypothetical protein
MGSQVVFYAEGADDVALVRMLVDAGLRAMPYVVPSEEANAMRVEAVTPGQPDTPQRGGVLYLLPPGLAAVEAFYQPLRRDPSQAMLDTAHSPVIEYRPSARQGDKLEPGRLFLDTVKDDPRYPTVRKSFDALARQLRTWPRIDRYHVGPHTAELARQGTLKLMAGARPWDPAATIRARA